MGKICYILEKIPPDFSGAGKRVFRQIYKLIGKGYEIEILTFTKENKNNYVKYIGFRNIFLSSNKLLKLLFSPILICRLMLILNKEKYDIVYCPIGAITLLTFSMLIINKFLKLKLVVGSTLVGSDDPLTIYNSMLGKMKIKLLKKVTATTSISPLLESIFNKMGINMKAHYMIPNSVDTELFKPVSAVEKNEMKAEFKLTGKILLLSVGSIIERKGIFELIEVFNLLKHKNEMHLLLIGPYDFKDFRRKEYVCKCINYIVSNKLDKNISFLGEKENVYKYMQMSDIFILNSKSEGFGNVIIEAQSCKLPTIVNSINGITNYIIKNNYNGIIINNKNEIKESIEKIIENEEFRNTLIKNSRDNVISRFTHNIILNKYIIMFREINNAKNEIDFN